METKICSKCGKELPLDQFNWRDKSKGTRRADCKTCHTNFMKQKYKEKKNLIQDLKSELKCAKCNAVLQIKDKFCSNCGEPFDGNNVVVSENANASVQTLPKVAVLPTSFDNIYKHII